jgi:curved DNA-binding protein CbpA
VTEKRLSPYEVLGVPSDASAAEVTAAYRRLLRRLHPDSRAPAERSSGGSAAEELKGVLDAYAVLHEPSRRAAYDRAAGRQQPLTRAPAPAHTGPRARSARTGSYLAGRDQDFLLIAGPVRWEPEQ